MSPPLNCFLMYSAQAVEKAMVKIAVKVKMMVRTTIARTRTLGGMVVGEYVFGDDERDSTGILELMGGIVGVAGIIIKVVVIEVEVIIVEEISLCSVLSVEFGE